MPSGVAEAAHAHVTSPAMTAPDGAAWLERFVWKSLWKIVGVGLAVAALLFAVYEARGLIGTLIISLFFALAIIPGVNTLQRKWGWRRGAAVGVIYAAFVVFLVFMVAVLVPAIVAFAEQVSANASGWIAQLNETSLNLFGAQAVDPEGTEESTRTAMDAIATWGDEALGLLTASIGLIFSVFTIAAFTFYIAADWPRIMRAMMSRMPPERQRVFGWVADTSIEQTGGYFYSRMLLMGVCGGSGFVVMLVAGLDLVYALPLALFMGFVSEFIPFIGTYIGAIIPILVLLAVNGLGSALVLTVWIVIYQQIENYVLSPRFSSKTMELNGAVAFGGALAGGAIAGPMGAFMALPVAALITAIIKNSGKTYDVVYNARFGSDGTDAAAQPQTEPDAEKTH